MSAAGVNPEPGPDGGQADSGAGPGDESAAAVADAHRREWAFVLAATARVAGDIDLAEECVQDAYVAALDVWSRQGVPRNPGAWLTTAARRRAIDALRRDRTLRGKLPLLIEPAAPVAGSSPPPAPAGEDDVIPDDRLRLVFTCCHPALAREAQVALTLRLVCGLTTTEIAQAFLVPEPTMAARVTRAKKKISAARIAYRVPEAAELPDRLDAVLTVVHLLYTTGHTAPGGENVVRDDLVERALDLARMLHSLMPDEREVRGLLALLLLTDARRAARTDDTGALVLLEEQDRTRWDQGMIADGEGLLVEALRMRQPGPYQLWAAIAACHSTAASAAATDWRQISVLYGELLKYDPSPVTEANRAIAVAMAEGPAAGLTILDVVLGHPQLATWPRIHVARADLLARMGRDEEAARAYRTALELEPPAAERRYIQRRLATRDPD
jgi:RNA polymerase sigma-70 factor (ECF subfamily)